MGLFKLEEPNVVVKGIVFKPMSKLDVGYLKDKLKLVIDPTWYQNIDMILSMYSRSKNTTLWLEYNGFICIFDVHNKGYTMKCAPIGDYMDRKGLFNTIKYCCNIIEAVSSEGYPADILVNEYTATLLDKSSKTKFKKSLANFQEYVYVISEVSECRGKEFEYVRRKINKFKRLYPDVIIKPYSEELYDSAIKLRNQWKDEVAERYFMLDDATYYKNLLLNYKQLDHIILCAFDKGKMVGIISGNIFNKFSYCIVRKPLNIYEGLSEYLIQELGKAVKEKDNDVVYINDGPADTDGLKFFKSHFNPTIKKVYFIKGIKK